MSSCGQNHPVAAKARDGGLGGANPIAARHDDSGGGEDELEEVQEARDLVVLAGDQRDVHLVIGNLYLAVRPVKHESLWTDQPNRTV